MSFPEKSLVKHSFSSLIAVLAVVAFAGVASASVQLNITTAFNFDDPPGVPPSGAAPFARVEIYDSVDASTDANLATYGLSSNDVLVVISSLVKDPGESIESVLFNFDLTQTKAGPGGLLQFNDFEVMLKTGTFENPTLSYLQGTDGSSPFDFKFNFNQQVTKTFDGSDKFYVKLKYDSSVLASNFNDANADGFYAAAHILGVPDSENNHDGQSFVADNTDDTTDGGPVPPVPEPATLAIWSLGLGIAGLVRLRLKK